MEIPEYITIQEVQRVCKQLKIRDWTKLKKAEVPLKEARIILAEINAGKMKIEIEEFCKGLENNGVRHTHLTKRFLSLSFC